MKRPWATTWRIPLLTPGRFPDWSERIFSGNSPSMPTTMSTTSITVMTTPSRSHRTRRQDSAKSPFHESHLHPHDFFRVPESQHVRCATGDVAAGDNLFNIQGYLYLASRVLPAILEKEGRLTCDVRRRLQAFRGSPGHKASRLRERHQGALCREQVRDLPLDRRDRDAGQDS